MVVLLVAGFFAFRWWKAEPPRRLCPPDEIYALKYFSATVPGGVVGFEPGRRLKIIRDRGNRLVVSDGKYEVETSVENLTNDLDIADMANRQDAASQTELGRMMASYRSEALRAQAATDAEHARRVNAVEARRVASGSVGSSNALDPATVEPGRSRRYYVPR